MEYLINGRGAFINIQKLGGDSVAVEFAWIDKWCPATIELEGFGEFEVPQSLRGSFSMIQVNIKLKIVKDDNIINRSSDG